jgi:protein gp37
MADNSAIEWTDATWNPIRARNLKTGKKGWHCEHASTGCEHCYSEGFNKRLGTGLPFKPGHRADIEIFLDENVLTQPLRWKKPRMIFVCSMTDLFADFVPDEWIDKMFAVMALCPQHTFQLLTKRAKRMRDYMTRGGPTLQTLAEVPQVGQGIMTANTDWPLPNVWLGVSTERQEEADERIPLLLRTPAAVRFISSEPLLGPIDMHLWMLTNPAIDWVIAGGESGPHARPMHPGWARDLRKQCRAASVPFFFKQWGEYLPVGQTLPGYGKVHGATAVKPGRMKLHYGGTPKEHPKHAFAERGIDFASTTDGRLTFRVGKKTAGRLLDGELHNAMPRVTA